MSEQEKSLFLLACEIYGRDGATIIVDPMRDAVNAVAARVREECAVLCESLTPKRIKNDYDAGEDFALERAALAIRAMNEASQ